MSRGRDGLLDFWNGCFNAKGAETRSFRRVFLTCSRFVSQEESILPNPAR